MRTYNKTEQYDLPNEEWRDLVCYPQTKGIYYISNLGRWKRKYKCGFKYSIGAKTSDGYLSLHINLNGVQIATPFIHDLVAEAFIRPIDYKNELCHHLNHIRSDNKLLNLRILTKQLHRLDEVTRQKISVANTGRFVSLQTRQKISAIHKGRKHYNIKGSDGKFVKT